MLQIRTYAPGASVSVSSSVAPTATSSISPCASIPLSSSFTAPVVSVGSASMDWSVLMTTNSCTSSGPLFVTANVTGPALAVATLVPTDHSASETATVAAPALALAAEVAVANGLPVAAPPPHPATSSTPTPHSATLVEIFLRSMVGHLVCGLRKCHFGRTHRCQQGPFGPRERAGAGPTGTYAPGVVTP